MDAAEIWDREYRTGRWNYLDTLEQAPRYAVLAAWCHLLSPGASILDVGCGEALLLEFLDRERYRRYRGIDFAPAAVERAQRRIVDHDRQRVTCAAAEIFDIASYAPDVVVFNESLYCCAEPLTVLQRALHSSCIVLLSITGFEAAFADEVRRRHEERLVAALTLDDRLCAKAWHLMALRRASVD